MAAFRNDTLLPALIPSPEGSFALSAAPLADTLLPPGDPAGLRSDVIPGSAARGFGGLLTSAVALCILLPGAALAGEARVQVRDGLISARFDATPAPEAFDAIHRATGVEVVVPPSTAQRTLTLAIGSASFEAFLQRVLHALDLGGFALVYAPGGGADRLIVVDKAQGAAPPTPMTARTPSVHTPRAGGPGVAGRDAVSILMRTTEAESMKLGAPGQVIVVKSSPIARTRTAECDGTRGDYPVQTVLVTDARSTFITSIVVCEAAGLAPGRTLTPTGTPMGGESTYSRFGAAVDRSTTGGDP